MSKLRILSAVEQVALYGKNDRRRLLTKAGFDPGGTIGAVAARIRGASWNPR